MKNHLTAFCFIRSQKRERFARFTIRFVLAVCCLLLGIGSETVAQNRFTPAQTGSFQADPFQASSAVPTGSRVPARGIIKTTARPVRPASQIQMPPAPLEAPIQIEAVNSRRWKEGVYDVWVLSGGCTIRQGKTVITGPQAVIWVDTRNRPQKMFKSLAEDLAKPKRTANLIVYVEGDSQQLVSLDYLRLNDGKIKNGIKSSRIAWLPTKKSEFKQADRRAKETTQTDESAAAASRVIRTSYGKQVLLPPESSARQVTSSWFGRFSTLGEVNIKTKVTRPATALLPEVYQNGKAQWLPSTAIQQPATRLAQYTTPLGAGGGTNNFAPGPQAYGAQGTGLQRAGPQGSIGGSPVEPNSNRRSFQLLPRNETPFDLDVRQTPSGEPVGVLTGGVKILVQGIEIEGMPQGLGPVGVLDIEADRVVIWSSEGLSSNSANREVTQSKESSLDFYLEGNIVFRQGERTIFADRMYYDVRRQVGIILDAELFTPLPETDGVKYQGGMVRLKAQTIRQLSKTRFQAQNAMLTTSRMEEPTYDVSSDEITFDHFEETVLNPYTGFPEIGEDGYPKVRSKQRVKSKGNYFHIAGVPVFYWPTFTTDLTQPTYYVSNIRIGNDSIFGFQTMLDLDMFQMLGWEEKPVGVDWDSSLDYLSDRGLGLGTDVSYTRDRFAFWEGKTTGMFDLWGIYDSGLDNLGRGRRAIVPEEKFRGRALWRHRQEITTGIFAGWTAQAEVGLVSDRTFLEQFYESEWDNQKNQDTGLRLRKIFGNQSLVLDANLQVNDFYTETSWLPRVDHYLMGESVFNGMFSWYEHTSLGYADLNVGTVPTNPQLAAAHNTLPWEVNAEGERFITRHEIDMPLDFEPFKIVPYVLGEFGHWGNDVNGNTLNRTYFQTGVRASIPFWSINPTVRDPLFNINGLAHKVVFDAEVSYTDTNHSFKELPLYDDLNDHSVNEFLSRLPAPISAKFDPRYYALRNGTQSWVTSSTPEIVEDQVALRLGMRHRLQTKRGPLGRQHIVDWMTFDTNVTLFPNANRDNFGSTVGLLDYDFRWHIGDRFSVVSDGAADFFSEGLKTFSVGMLANRPMVGNGYLGFRSISGPIESNVVTASFSYRLSPKWVTSVSTSVDFGDTGNIGQSLYVSRIGESFIVSVGANVDSSKDNVGFKFMIEPRFLPSQLKKKTGLDIEAAGAYGLE